MSRRDNVEARCAVCRLNATLCICALVPRLRTRTRLVLLVHYREARKPSILLVDDSLEDAFEG